MVSNFNALDVSSSVNPEITNVQPTPSITGSDREVQRNGENESLQKIEEKQRQKVEEALKNISKEDIEDITKKLIKTMKAFDIELQFEVYKPTNDIMVKIYDSKTKKVIREIPPKKVLDMVAKMLEMVGLLVDEKA